MSPARVLVVISSEGVLPLRADRCAITVGRDIASAVGGPCHLLVLGGTDAVMKASACSNYGMERVLVAADGSFESRMPEAFVDTLAYAAEPYAWIVAAGTDFNRDLLPRAASRRDDAYAGDCLRVTATKGEILVERALFSGTARGYFRLTTARGFLTCRACTCAPAEPLGAPVPVERIAIPPSTLAPPCTEVLEDLPAGTDHERLSAARVVVSGGRGTKGQYAEVIRPLAEALGAVAAATRAVCDEGFAPRDSQVGQSGQTIAPRLYIALGISGAVHHLAGVKDAGTIVAINRDRNAPIFQSADIGLVANLFDVVPEMIRRLRSS